MGEKLIKLLGGIKHNPLGDAELDIPSFLRNVLYIVVALMSLSFTAGHKFSTAAGMPTRIDAVESRVVCVEKEQNEIKEAQAVTAVQLNYLVDSMKGLTTDVREIRNSQKGR